MLALTRNPWGCCFCLWSFFFCPMVTQKCTPTPNLVCVFAFVPRQWMSLLCSKNNASPSFCIHPPGSTVIDGHPAPRRHPELSGRMSAPGEIADAATVQLKECPISFRSSIKYPSLSRSWSCCSCSN